MDNPTVPNSTPEPVLTSNQVEVVETKPKSNKLLVGSLLLLSLLLLLSTAFLYYQNMQLKNMLAGYQTHPVVSPSPMATTYPTANWKTYTSVQYGISFKYPSGWTVDENWGSSGFPNFHYIALIKNQNVKYGPEPGAFGITAYDNPKNLTLQEFEATNSSPTGSIGVYDPSAKSMVLGNVTASFSSDANCEPVLCSKYVISANKEIFFISIYKDAIKNDQQTVDQILSTFKFTN